MIELNANELCLEIKKRLTFANHVYPVWEECKEYVYGKELENKLKNYELTKEDKIELIGYVQDVYEAQQYDIGAEDIFSYEIIRDAVMKWIDDNFTEYILKK